MNAAAKENKLKGYIAGIVAAVAYGTNPLGALFLYDEGLSPASVIFYRFALAVAILFVILKIQRVPLKLDKRELKLLVSLGFIFAVSALTLYSSFRHIDSGIASTILFVYPVMVAVIMAVFFKEKATFSTIFSIVLSLAGIVLLYQGDGGGRLSVPGVILVLVSALTYAIYIVIVNQSGISLPPFKMTFYIMLFATIVTVLFSFVSPENHLMALPTWRAAGWVLMLALVPTIVAMTCLNVGIAKAGSTPTAILGALEPATAVMISIAVFGCTFSLRLAAGIALILSSVLIIVVMSRKN